ncbi:MAG: methionine adenosyltransferase [Planctomycetales bacterium]|nr:methionine adenosyltransferase [Planctomycetales bacterium]
MIEQIQLFETSQGPMDRRPFEYVERKGLGHPDTICDSVMEHVAVSLSEAYLQLAGHVLHFNVDKALFVAGRSEPKFGGGSIIQPMQFIVGDRATMSFEGKEIPVDEIVEQAIRNWFSTNLRFVDPDDHLRIRSVLQPGSPELVSVYSNHNVTSNDTSVGVGYAPLSETESLVLEAERFLNSRQFKDDFPATGEDIKVMGVRQGHQLDLTVAIAFVDRFISDASTYQWAKNSVTEALSRYLESRHHLIRKVTIAVNTLDRLEAGVRGAYLTVLGTSADGADSGQVGRGNRSNGLISLTRPMSLEAVAGKNPVGHVGKVYNVLANQMANAIFDSRDEVEEVCVWLCSRIGWPLERPWSVSVQLSLVNDAFVDDIEDDLYEIIGRELDAVGNLSHKLMLGEIQLD